MIPPPHDAQAQVATSPVVAAAVPDPAPPPGPRRGCSIAAALAIVGDRWSLLAIREIAMGIHRFQAIAINTGAPRDVLTARLRKLEAEHVIARESYSDRPPRYEYVLTPAGQDLLPILLALRDWGNRHAAGDPASVLTHSCGARFAPLTTCAACGEPARAEDLSAGPP